MRLHSACCPMQMQASALPFSVAVANLERDLPHSHPSTALLSRAVHGVLEQVALCCSPSMEFCCFLCFGSLHAHLHEARLGGAQQKSNRRARRKS